MLDRRGFLGSAAALAGVAALEGNADAAPLYGRTPHTRFAVNVEMWWGRLPFLDRIRAAARLGFPAVEFWPHRGKEISAVADLTAELGGEGAQFTAWGFSPGLNERKHHDRFEEAIREACDVARNLRCEKATVVGGNDVAGVPREAMHEAIVEGLRRVAPIAEANDLTLILEPMNVRVDHPGHCLFGSVDAVRICRAVGSSHVKVNWDLYHMQISEGDLCGRLRDGFDQVGYLQLADHPGRHEPGTGEIAYARVLREALALGYTGYVGLECSPRDGEETAARRVLEADTW